MSKITFIIIFFVHISFASDNASFVNAVNELKDGNQLVAVEKLLKVFHQTNSFQLQGQTAYILATLNAPSIAKERSYFAQIAIKKNSHLNEEDRLKLIRMTADLLFKEGNLAEAERYFKMLLKDNKFAEYATYKLGWVYINMDKYSLVFSLWEEWSKNRDSGELFDMIIADYGKFIVEHLFKTSQIKPNIPENILKSKYFLEGIVNGYKRYQTKSPHKILEQLGHHELAKVFLNNSVLQTRYFTQNACNILKVPFNDQLDTEIAEKILNACFGKSKKEKDIHQLLQFVQKYNFQGNQRYGIASIYFQLKNFKEAQFEFSKALIEINFENKGDLIKGLIGFLTSLQQNKEKIFPTNEILSKIMSSQQLAKNYQEDQMLRQLVDDFLLIHATDMRSVKEFLIRNILLWKKTDLPVKIFEKFSSLPDLQLELAKVFKIEDKESMLKIAVNLINKNQLVESTNSVKA